MASADPIVPKNVPRLMQKLGRLIEITRVVELNGADAKYRDRKNGHIEYVFDTNVFQMFLQPYSFSRYVELFNSTLWGISRAEQSVNAEAALVAGEYLLSGHLPGQRAKTVIVSSWHNIELLEQIGFLFAQVRETAKLPNYAKEARKGLAKLEQLVQLLISPNEPAFQRALDAAVPTARDDDDFLKNQNVSTEQRIEIFAVRAICSLLAHDRYTEPLDQLHRLLSGKVAAFVPHNEMTDLPAGADKNDKLFQAAKREWKQRLKDADRALQHRHERGLRAENSLDNDASTLAWLDAASQTSAGAGKRLVFVTGDRVLLNACRRRNAEDPTRPFFVRSVQHFAPILNLSDAVAALRPESNAQAHFLRLRQSLEQSLAFLNISLAEKDEKGQPLTHFIRGRDNFVVDAEEHDGDFLKSHHQYHFPPYFDQDWTRQREAELDAIAKPIQDLERVSISSFRDKVIARVETSQARKLLKEWGTSENAEALGPIIEKVIEKLIDDVSLATLEFAVKSAPDFLTTLRSEPPKSFTRAVFQMRLRFPVEAGKEVIAADYVGQLVQDDLPSAAAKIEQLRHRPDLLLALGTLLAFRAERWGLAASIAELAVEASAGRPLEARREIEYIKAVALRYRMASVQPSKVSTEDVWLRWLLAAQEALQTSFETAAKADATPLQIRARAELAAVGLAYLEWIAYERIDRLPAHEIEGQAYRVRIETLLEDVTANLLTCQALDEGFDGAEGAAPLDLALRNHWRWNMLVADVTSGKLVEQGLLRPDLRTNFVDQDLKAELAATQQSHLIYEIYLRSLTRDLDDATAARLRRRRGELSLALDRAVAFDLLKDRLPKPKSRK